MPSFPKRIIVRSTKYLRYVASQPCSACGIHGFSQAAHPNHGKGLSLKTSDLEAFPLCCSRPGHQGCHVLHDLCLDMTRSERRELEAKYTTRMHLQAMMDKRPEFAEAA